MKKTILILVILALLVPAAALAATEFSLGGYIKLDSFWDSTQEGTRTGRRHARNNDPQFHHGRFHDDGPGDPASTSPSRDPSSGAPPPPVSSKWTLTPITDRPVSGTNSYAPRLRHAMFRLNWPETELMFGQYWTMFCEYCP